MRVIGTAGHVDHGKSTLVNALTGINPDRLEEEQARQMTIDLGFAWLQLPDGETLGIVDVPGHEDFIENMLAGVGGIDAGLLVIAADEGVMPQTREHLAILDLLAIPKLLVALTKIDAVDDPDWLELVELDISETLGETRFADAEIIHVSAHTRTGIDTLVDALTAMLQTLPSTEIEGNPRLPIDRVFTLSGFGTVVTGTLLGGSLKVGETIEIQPTGQQARIRGLQSHNENVEIALPGSRTAVNLTGVDKSDVNRGFMLTHPHALQPTQLIDVELHHLAHSPRPLKHNTEVKFFAGTTEAIARVRLLMDDTLLPGVNGWAQIQLREPIPVIQGQHFILRLPSPAETVGGGVILDTAPGRKWKRRREEVAARFERLTSGQPIDIVSECLIQARRPMKMSEISRQIAMDAQTLDTFIDSSEFIIWEEWVIHEDTFSHFREAIREILGEFHTTYPLQVGIHFNTLCKRLRLEDDAFDALISILHHDGEVEVANNQSIHLPDFEVRFTKAQQTAIDNVLKQFEAKPYTPPSVKEVSEAVGHDVLDALIGQGYLVQINPEVILLNGVYFLWVDYAKNELSSGNALKVSSFRDQFQTSRKYALGFLEYLESHQITRRVGDEHVAGRGDWSRLTTP